jgi:predicted CoA-binding protein
MAEHAERREPEAESACELPQGNPPDSEVRRLLGEIRTVAIVGLSDNPERDSYRVAAYLQKQGLRILPVNPNVREVLGEKAYGDLVSLPVKPDAVVVFRRPEAVPAIVEQAKQIGAKVLWLQRGIVHNAAAQTARQAGMHVVQNRCIMQEHQRLLKTNEASAQ